MQMLVIKYFILSFLVFVAFQSEAQTLVKERQSAKIWAFANIDYQTKSGNQLFFELNLRYNTATIFPKVSNVLPFERVQLLLGYQWKFNEFWYAGISERFAIQPTVNISFTKFFVSHKGKIKSVEFVKSLGFEYTIFNQKNTIGSERDDLARFSLYSHLAKKINIGKSEWETTLSYELFQWYEFDKEKRTKDNQRRIDKTRLKLAFDYLWNEKTTLGIFLMRETDYFFFIATGGRFDPNGNEISPPQPDRNFNKIVPTYGFRFKYVIGKENSEK